MFTLIYLFLKIYLIYFSFRITLPRKLHRLGLHQLFRGVGHLHLDAFKLFKDSGQTEQRNNTRIR